MLWEIAEHKVAITGDGFYSPDYFGDRIAVRCIADPGEEELESNHVLWAGEEGIAMEDLDVDVQVVVETVVEHLRSSGVEVPAETVEAALTMSALSSEIYDGLSILYAHFGGGKRLYSDDEFPEGWDEDVEDRD